jgi:hypothetical protein
MDDIREILTGFNTYQPDEANEVGLMKRMDRKYIFHYRQLVDLLPELKMNYNRLNIDNVLIPGYNTLYFDTDDFLMYHQHHNGKLDRYKIRHRIYLDSGMGFLEIKHKTNRNIVKKIRINTSRNELLQYHEEFISSRSPFTVSQLKPSISTDYNRITFANIENRERITFDGNIIFRYENRKLDFENLVICEVKMNPGNRESEFERILKERRIKPFSISKYCIGNYFLNDSIKQNLFKEKALFINKLINS